MSDNPFINIITDKYRREGTPESMRIAHDIELISDTWGKVISREAPDWHNTAAEMLIRGDTLGTMLTLAESDGNPEQIETILINTMAAWFYVGYLLGEGGEHITPCRCAEFQEEQRGD